MFDHSTLGKKELQKPTATALQALRLQKILKAWLTSDQVNEASLLGRLREEEIVSPRLLSSLEYRSDRLLRRLRSRGILTPEQTAERADSLRSICFESIEEEASPLHQALSSKSIYSDSDLPTRRQLRAALLHFQKRHRLTAEQALSLWEGEASVGRPTLLRLIGKTALWLPLLLTTASCILLCLLFWQALSFGALLIVLALFCPIWSGFSLLTEASIRLLLPTARLPVLKREKASPVYAMLTASVKDNPERTLRSLEMLISANRQCEGVFGLILTLPDAPTRHTSEDDKLIAPFLQAFEKLEKRSDRPLRLCVAERSYLPAEKRWKGCPTSDELMGASAWSAVGEDRGFCQSFGKKQASQAPAALYIAPADSLLSPDGLRALSCTLFHPLCTADCILPILSSGDSERRRLPERLSALTCRQVTLQKTGRSLPFLGYGMVRLSTLTRSADRPSLPRLKCALAESTLFVRALPMLDSTAKQTEEGLLISTLPALRERLGALLRLPLYLFIMSAPFVPALAALIVSSSDLIAEVLLSLRTGQGLSTYTIPHLLRAGKRSLCRRLFPAQQFFSALPLTARLSGRLKNLLASLFAVCVGISAAAFLPFPFSAVGLCWAFSPLFAASVTEKRTVKPLSAADRATLLAQSRKCWAFFERFVTSEHPLPPTVCKALPYLSPSSDTAPDAFAFYLLTCLSACDLGLIDPFTLERRVSLSLDAWEKLPTYHRLPYARYSLKTLDSIPQSGVSASLCGRFALSMASLSAGLKEYAEQNKALEGLSSRVDALWQGMELSRFYDNERHLFYQTLYPSGSPVGSHDLLMSPAQSVCIAALALGQIDRAAWKKLARPAAHGFFRLGMRSEWGTLEDYLLDALFLPSADDSLTGRARKRAIRSNAPDRRNPLSIRSAAYRLMPDGRLSDAPIESGHTSLAALHSIDTPNLSPPHAAFLMLPFRPSLALKSLRAFEAVGALGRFGFYEAVESGSGEHQTIVRIWSSAHLGQSMTATVNCLKSNAFLRRLMRNPAFAALTPLLNEPFDRLGRDCLPRLIDRNSANERQESRQDAFFRSIFLLGDSHCGLLWTEGGRILPFYRGEAMAYPASPHYIYDDGRFSGLMLFLGQSLLPIAPQTCRSEKNALVFSYRSDRSALLVSYSIPEEGLFEIRISCDGYDEPPSALLCYSPRPSGGTPFKLESLPTSDLLLIYSSSYTAALAAEGLDRLFIRAEEAPMPLGSAHLSSLLDREGRFTEGRLLTPFCKIGGRLNGGRSCRIWLAFGEDRRQVCQKLRHAGQADESSAPPDGSLLPLPSEHDPVKAYALSLQLQFLFETLKLRPVRCDIADRADGKAAFSPHLHDCLEESLRLLERRGFERGEAPYSLALSGDLPTDELLKASLRPKSLPPLISPPLPERTRIRLTDASLTVIKGRDLPPVCRSYSVCGMTFCADSFTPSLRFEGCDCPLSLILTLPDQTTDHERSLFYAASEVCYTESEVCYKGEDYSVTARLSSARHLLILEVNAPLPATLRPIFSDKVKHSEESAFRHRDSMVDFCSRSICEGRTLFLLGSFSAESDKRYYLIREEMNDRFRNGAPLSDYESPSTLLTWQSRAPYPTPLLLHPALASDCPEAFPILLFFRESASFDALVQLFSTENRLMQVIACLLWAEFTDDREALRQKLVRSTPSGKVEESIYLSAARALESMQEKEESPLLPYLTAAFADLAHDMGDYSGETLYRGWQTHLPSEITHNTSSNHSHSFEEIACLLLTRHPLGGRAWKEKIDALPLFPSPEEAGALWSLFWFGLLGYRETPSSFTLHPLPCEAFEGHAFTLQRKETLYRIRISFSDHCACLLDGEKCDLPFLFDKKAHFLEITVEKSSEMV